MSDAQAIMAERFGGDTVMSLATLDGDRPSVRPVDAFYEGGAFYVITHARSPKMDQIRAHPVVGIGAEWFSGHGRAESLGHVLAPSNTALMARARAIFAAWLDNGDLNLTDPDTVFLRIRLTDGVLWSHGTRYDLDPGILGHA